MATKTWLGNDAGNEGDLSVAANYSPSGVPTTGDTIVVDASSSNITAGLDTFASVAIASLQILAAIQIGTSADSMQIDAGSVRIEAPCTGSIHFSDTSTPAAVDIIEAPGTSGALKLSGDFALNKFERGQVTVIRDHDFGTHGNPTAVSAAAQVGPSATLRVEENVTLNGGTINGGTLRSQVATGNWTMNGGLLITSGSASIGAITARGARIEHGGSGNVTGSLIGEGAGSFTDSNQAYTVSQTVELDGTFTFEPGSRVTFSGSPNIRQETAGKSIRLPAGATVSVTMPAA